MTENQSISEKEKLDNQPCPDFLSELPLSIIHIILARVPIREAIRTSLLSSQWRYTWTSLPYIVIEDYRRDHELKCKFEERMERFIRNALFQHKGPIRKFKMYVFFEKGCPDINEWILHLSRNEIRKLILHPGNSYSPPQVNNIYSCEKLTTLHLDNCELDPPPSTFKGFFFLRCLYLHEIYLSSDGIESLVADSPLLERFELVNQNEYDTSELSISAPNLKSLHVCDWHTEICLYAPLLVEMSVRLNNDDFTSDHQQQNSSVCNYTDVIDGLTNLEELRGSRYFAKFMSIGIESCHRTLVFHHLKDIELNDVNFKDKKEILAVARLITGAPNLHKLRISTNSDVRWNVDVPPHSEATEICFGDFGCEPNFKFEKLRFIRMGDLSGFPSEFHFMQFLIESSPVLESMKIFHISSLSTEEKERSSAELLDCCWASPNAKFFVLDEKRRSHRRR